MIDKNKKFDLNALIDEEDMRKTKAASARTKAYMEEDAWHKEHEPNYEQWKDERDKELLDWAERQWTGMTIAEREALYRNK